jgi:hypothetical protein
VLALGALPGLVGSHVASQPRTIDAAAFRQVNLATTDDRQSLGQITADAAGRSDGALDPFGAIAESAVLGPEVPGARVQPTRQDAGVSWSWKKPRYTMSGYASFYDHGTTAMRIPRGTTVVICGAGGCIERVVTDYGPSKAGGRIVDMYRPDFFKVCGCGWWSGTTEVTIRVY